MHPLIVIMDTKQREICVKLFKWNVNKPILPIMKVCIQAKEYEEAYEKFKKDKDNYLKIINTEFEKYPVVKYQMYETANRLMDENMEEVKKISYKRAIKEINPILSTAIKRMHAIFQSMLSSQEQVLDCYNRQTTLIDALFNIKNQELIKISSYIHYAVLYASDILDTVFKQLIDVLDELAEKNKDCVTKLVEHFTKNIEKYESLSAGLGLEGVIYVIGLDDNGYAHIKEQLFDMSMIEADITIIWSLL